MDGVRIFYHVEERQYGYFVVYSGIVEAKIPVSLPSPTCLKLNREGVRRFYRDFLLRFEGSLLSQPFPVPVKHFFVDKKALTDFVALGVTLFPEKHEIFRTISLTGVDLLPDPSGFKRADKLYAALLLFGDRETAEEVLITDDDD